MLKTLNKYCSNCRGTQRFLDLSTHLLCECCSKRLDRIQPDRGRKATDETPFEWRRDKRLPSVRREAM